MATLSPNSSKAAPSLAVSLAVSFVGFAVGALIFYDRQNATHAAGLVEAIVTADIIRATHQAAREGFDALVIGCFYDTALRDARSLRELVDLLMRRKVS